MTGGPLRKSDAAALERCLRVGGVALFPADTVYGLACEPSDPEAVRRLYALKGRVPDKPAAVMFFSLELALVAMGELGPETADALTRLLPGPVTVLVPNPAGRFPLACADDPATLGVRVPQLPPMAAGLGAMQWPMLQSSANLAGAPEARTVAEVPESMRAGVDLVLDAGPLPGRPSTVIDLRRYERSGKWSIVREGALSPATIAQLLG
jgi:L-threonylcarbamoyladenylate synthase